MLGIIAVLSLGMAEKMAMFFLVKNKENQQIKIMINFLFVSIIFLITSFFLYDEFDFSFLKDYKFYITVLLENLVFFYAIRNYNKQKNFTQIAFGAFSSIYLMIGIGYFYRILMNLNTTISSPYNNIQEVVGFSLFFFVLTMLYFSDKIKNKDIKHPIDLLLYSILLVNTLFFAILMFQTYQSFLLYIFIFITLVVQQFISLVREKGFKRLKSQILLSDLSKEDKKDNIKNGFLYSFFYLITFSLSVISGGLIAVEFFAIFKRVGAVLSSYILDAFIIDKEVKIPLKDKIILFVIIVTAFYLFFR